MDHLLEFSQKSSELSQDFFPPIALNPQSNYVIGLYSLTTYNSISNIKESNNAIAFVEPSKPSASKRVKIPSKKYNLTELEKYIRQQLSSSGIDFELNFDDVKKKLELNRIVRSKEGSYNN